MRALIYVSPHRVVIDDWPRQEPAYDEVEIAVTSAGICGADVAGFLGRSRRRLPPLILGHELVGIAPDGRRVVVDPLVTCGDCEECRNGAGNLCSGLRLLGMDRTDGCFAEFVAVPSRQVHPIPEDVGDLQAIYAEPLANIVHLFRLAGITAPFRMGVIGAGIMGSMAIRVARQLGASEILVEDVVEARLRTARKLGATLAVHAQRGQAEARSFGGRGLDLVLDACGTEEARQEAFDLCRPGGQVVLMGMAHERSALNFGACIRKEQRVLMSFGYTAEDFRRSLELLAAGEMDLGPWTAEMRLEEGQAAFEKMCGDRDDILKTMLRVR